MRLIDADSLKQELRKHQIESLIAHTEEKNVFDIIDEQPTAYDVEKVVAELDDNAIEFEFLGICSDYVLKARAKQIVRNGGKE